MSLIRSLTRRGMSTYVSVVISPATTTRPVVTSVSHATRPAGSSVRTASRTASETWSATLSGWPSVTDSEVKRNECGTALRLIDAQEAGEMNRASVLLAVDHETLQRLEVRAHLRRRLVACLLDEAEHVGNRVREVDVREPAGLLGHARLLEGVAEVLVVGQTVSVLAKRGDAVLRARD